MKRFACYFCPDYSAEYADLSFGGIGAEEGWTSVIIRSPVGRAIFADARAKMIEEHRREDFPRMVARMLKKVHTWSASKKDKSTKNRKLLSTKFPEDKRSI
jgi:coenzyme F420 hydrogenase subunit beta